MTPPRIVLIERDVALQRHLCAQLTDAGCAVIGWRWAMGAHALIRREHPDAVVLDLRLEDAWAGTRLIEELRYDPDTTGTPVMLLNADAAQRGVDGETLATSGKVAAAPPFDLACLLIEALGKSMPCEPVLAGRR
jgi:DNA-binding response OmpR family regulator